MFINIVIVIIRFCAANNQQGYIASERGLFPFKFTVESEQR